MKVSSNLRGERGKGRRSNTGSTPRITPNSQSAIHKIKERQKKRWRGIVDILYNFPQHGFFAVLFGLLALGGAIAALVFKVDSPMFMQILCLVGAGCGVNVGAEVVKHFKPTAKASPDQPSD